MIVFAAILTEARDARSQESSAADIEAVRQSISVWAGHVGAQLDYSRVELGGSGTRIITIDIGGRLESAAPRASMSGFRSLPVGPERKAAILTVVNDLIASLRAALPFHACQRLMPPELSEISDQPIEDFGQGGLASVAIGCDGYDRTGGILQVTIDLDGRLKKVEGGPIGLPPAVVGAMAEPHISRESAIVLATAYLDVHGGGREVDQDGTVWFPDRYDVPKTSKELIMRHGLPLVVWKVELSPYDRIDIDARTGEATNRRYVTRSF